MFWYLHIFFCHFPVVCHHSTVLYMSFLWVLIIQVQATHLVKKIMMGTYLLWHPKVHVYLDLVLSQNMIGIGLDGLDGFFCGFYILQSSCLEFCHGLFICLTREIQKSPLFQEAITLQTYVLIKSFKALRIILLLAPWIGDVELLRYLPLPKVFLFFGILFSLNSLEDCCSIIIFIFILNLFCYMLLY